MPLIKASVAQVSDLRSDSRAALPSTARKAACHARARHLAFIASMAKRRQRSHSSKVAANRSLSSLAREPARAWEKRVFKNTYVRSGKRKEVRGWAVRIQFEGTRKTFSLKAQARRAAAAEAREIYQAILTQGWDAAAQLQNLRRGSRSPGEQLEESPVKEDPRYW